MDIFIDVFQTSPNSNGNLSSPLAPLWGEDRHMRSRTFLYEIQFQTTFI